MVCYKIRIQLTTIKQILKALNNLRFKKTKGDMNNQIKRSLLCGGDQKIYRTVDLLEGLSDAEIAGFVEGLTPSQEALIVRHCRRILNGILLIQGPAGSGKTSMIKIIVQIAHRRGLKVAVVADSDSAADNAVDKVADRSYIAVRVHAQGIKCCHLLGTSRKGVDPEKIKLADPEPDEDAEHGATNTDDTLFEKLHIESDSPAENAADYFVDDTAGDADYWKDDPVDETLFTDILMRSTEDTYNNAKAIMSWDDTRMRKIQSALFTWILKIIDFLPKDEDATEVNAILRRLSATTPFIELRFLMHKSRQQKLNSAEWTKYGNFIAVCAVMFVTEAARATVCTIAQLGMEWAKGIKFDWTIVDEATVITEAQFVQVWGESDLIILVGDQQSLRRSVMSTAKDNPFADQGRYSPLMRFIENGWPYFMLREVVRSTAGLEALCSELFYRGQLKLGFATALSDETRAMTRIWQEKTRSLYPSLSKEPEGLAYPVFLNVVGAKSQAETRGGRSRLNVFNISAVMDHVVWLVEKGIARTDQIGIAMLEESQVQLYHELFRQLDKPDHQWELIRVGGIEWWQRKQAECMVVDLVRASNDQGNLGFLADSHRLSVLLSRQSHALTTVGDKHCTKPKTTGNENADKKVAEKSNKTNEFVIKLFDWMQKKGRSVEVLKLSQHWINLASKSANDFYALYPASAPALVSSPPSTGPPPVAASASGENAAPPEW